MKFRRPRSLNGLILVGFGLVALPLLIAVIWALVSLDRVAKHSEQLMITGVSAAESNRRLAQQLSSLERVARQYQVLQSPDSLQILSQDLEALEATLVEVAPLAERAAARTLADNIRVDVRVLVATVTAGDLDEAALAAEIAKFGALRQQVDVLPES